MQKLMTAENPSPERRARFIASFNRGYRSFEGTYSTCTASATEAIARYMKEGEAADAATSPCATAIKDTLTFSRNGGAQANRLC